MNIFNIQKLLICIILHTLTILDTDFEQLLLGTMSSYFESFRSSAYRKISLQSFKWLNCPNLHNCEHNDYFEVIRPSPLSGLQLHQISTFQLLWYWRNLQIMKYTTLNTFWLIFSVKLQVAPLVSHSFKIMTSPTTPPNFIKIR